MALLHNVTKYAKPLEWFIDLNTLCCVKLTGTTHVINKGSYMSAHVLLNLLNKFTNIDKMRGLPSIYLFFVTSLINSVIQECKC